MTGKSHLTDCGPATSSYLALMNPAIPYMPTLSQRPLPSQSCLDNFPWHCQALAGGSSGRRKLYGNVTNGLEPRQGRQSLCPHCPTPGPTPPPWGLELLELLSLCSAPAAGGRSLATESRVLGIPQLGFVGGLYARHLAADHLLQTQ